MWFEIIANIVIKAVGRSLKYFFIPLGVGLISFLLLHDFISTKIWIRAPFLIDLPLSPYLNHFGGMILGASGPMDNNKLLYLYFVLMWTLIIGLSYHVSPAFWGPISWAILFCFIEYFIIRYNWRPAEWQLIIWNLFGVSIERCVDFEDLRIIHENFYLTHYCIEPGINPCKLARDCINGHEKEGKLMQYMIEHLWTVTEDYESWAGLAGKYVDKIGPRYTAFSEWYWWYDVWPDPATLPKDPEPENMYEEEPFWYYVLALGAGSFLAFGVIELATYLI